MTGNSMICNPMIGNSRCGPTASPIEIIYLCHLSGNAPQIASVFEDSDPAQLFLIVAAVVAAPRVCSAGGIAGAIE
jgi:hypothetical protein